MEITSVGSFVNYYNSIWDRTKRTIKEIPKDKIDWKPSEDSFSFKEIITHLLNIERRMFVRNFQQLESTYDGHVMEHISSYEEMISFVERMHLQIIDQLENLENEDLNKKCVTPAGAKITTWKWMRAMIEHQVHHRGQIYMYLRLIGQDSFPLFGLTSEEVKEKSI